MNKKIKKGFTLAEVLLTLLIIGVIAAIVIPSLIQDTKKAELVVKLKKTYSILSQAHKTLDSDYKLDGNTMLWGGTTMSYNGNFMNAFASRLNTIKTCPASGGGCWYASAISYLNPNSGSYKANADTSQARTILADGTLLMFWSNGNNCTSDYGEGPLDKKVCGSIAADINGYSAPNTVGRDVFFFYVTKSGIYPWGGTYDTTVPMATYCNPSGEAALGYGDGCTAKVLKEDAMNY